MEQLWGQIRQLRGRPGALAAFSLGVAAVWLLLVAIVGALVVSDRDGTDLTASDGGDESFLDDRGGVDRVLTGEDGAAVEGADRATTTVVGSVALPGSVAGGDKPGPSAGVDPDDPAPDFPSSAGGGPGAPAPAPSGGDATGVTATGVKIGMHAPTSLSGVPVNLAEDPIKGIETYIRFINESGGINGRKIILDLQDDRFDSDGARRAANTLINDHKNFMVSGTLGIDQIAIVAAEAAKRGVPYTAAGGNEKQPIPGMFQVAANYTTHAMQLADYMAVDPKYKGKRVGILVADSEFVRPVAHQLKQRLEVNGNPVSTIVVNQKPTQNPDYNGYVLQFRQSNTEVVVPLTDPLTTQQIVQRCVAGAACGWTYSFSNFAHDSDAALALMAPTWAQQRVRGLVGNCYYLAPQVEDKAKCANMSVARDQYVTLHGQGDWEENGSGAALGYQVVGMLKGALTTPGADLTRERFVAALRSYQNYSDLISGPITFAGSDNTMRGATKMAVFEAQPNNKYRMISDGLLGGF